MLNSHDRSKIDIFDGVLLFVSKESYMYHIGRKSRIDMFDNVTSIVIKVSLVGHKSDMCETGILLDVHPVVHEGF
jgi:hypothetical protein